MNMSYFFCVKKNVFDKKFVLVCDFKKSSIGGEWFTKSLRTSGLLHNTVVVVTNIKSTRLLNCT